MAAQENRVEIVTYLLENGARANLATEVIMHIALGTSWPVKADKNVGRD